MKILLVDDDLEKIKAIEKSIKELPVVIDIDIAMDIYSAKELLSKKFYDLLILDLNLPYENGGVCDEASGYGLLIEIQKVNIFKKPRNILIITSFENLHEKYKHEIDHGLFKIIKYSTFSIEWDKEIKKHITYIEKSGEDSLDISDTGYDFDVAILTAVEVERIQLLKHIICPENCSVKGDPTQYTKGKFQKRGKSIDIVTATQHQMGIAAASTLTLKMIKNFKPRYICMIGIAAGKRDKGNLGDIIIPTEVWDYGSGKISGHQDSDAVNGSYLFQPDPKYLALNVEIKEVINKNYRDVLDKIKNEWTANTPDTSLNLIKGPMACGSIVVQNEDLIKKYIDPHNRKLKGIDMESYGVFYAAENAYMPKPKVIVCKSICDFADSEKNDIYQSYAAYTSASFLKHLLLEELF